jgi:predicted PolB exonuclease-like 3'-5' exonuclease
MGCYCSFCLGSNNCFFQGGFMTDAFTVFDIETTGFSPFEDRVVCICTKAHDGMKTSFSASDERQLLLDFCEHLLKYEVGKLVAYNGYSFDVPFLRIRCLKHNINMPFALTNEGNQQDPYHLLCRNRKGKQTDFATLFGMVSIGSGAESKELFEKGEVGTIVEHCESDVEVLFELTKRLLDCGFKLDRKW